MKNPFIYGQIVSGDDFADREEELKLLQRKLLNAEKVFLISPRRYGKSSLIDNVLKLIRGKGLYTAYIDLYRASSFKEFLELYTFSVCSAAETGPEKLTRLIRTLLPKLRPRFMIEPDGRLSLAIDISKEADLFKMAEEVYNAPQKIAEKKGRNFAVVFDEFQEIRSFNGEKIEKTMRAFFQRHRNVGYIFAGSKRHILYDMSEKSASAFYKIGPVITLQKIPREAFREFLRKKFEVTDYIVEEGVVDRILDMVEDYPYNAQYLCHEIWEEKADTKTIKFENVNDVLGTVLTRNSPVYLSMMDNLTLFQRKVLRAIARHGGENVFSDEYIRSNELVSASMLQKSLRLLRSKDLLDRETGRYFIPDVFLKLWLKSW
jgi:AAA+ ATPase superfamily predicted ATPase